MRTVLNERVEVAHIIEVDVANCLYYMAVLLSTCQLLAELDADAMYIQHVPKDLRDEVFLAIIGDGIRCTQALDPCLYDIELA